jgi:hypothetical protein
MRPLPSLARPMHIASLVTAMNVLAAAGFSIAGLVSPESILPVSYVPAAASFIFAMYAAAPTIPLAFITLIAIYKNLGSGRPDIGDSGRFHPIAGWRGRAVAA